MGEMVVIMYGVWFVVVGLCFGVIVMRVRGGGERMCVERCVW